VVFLNGETKKVARISFPDDRELYESRLVATGSLNGSEADVVEIDGLDRWTGAPSP